MNWCHTDLGANVLRWPRLMQEDRRFGVLGPKANGMSAEHFDGIMVMDLLSDGVHLEYLGLGACSQVNQHVC